MGHTPRAAPPPHYFAVVDVTTPVDSVAFSHALSTHSGWQNVATFLAPDTTERERLVDPGHPYLPVYKLDPTGHKTASAHNDPVILPFGLDVLPPTWQPPQPMPQARDTRFWNAAGAAGRRSFIVDSWGFLRQFVLAPGVWIGGGGNTLFDARAATPAGMTPVPAEILYLSSHGWLGGFMRGEFILPLPGEASGTALNPYFAIGHLNANLLAQPEASRVGFQGPSWLVLALCSTVNVATWPLWIPLLAYGNPPVRGVLAYEEASPAAGDSAAIATTFFQQLDAGSTFIEAWIAANGGPSGHRNWSAIVHRSALGDKLSSWDHLPPLEATPAARMGSYLGFLHSNHDTATSGHPITVTTSRSFTAAFEIWSSGAGWAACGPENLEDPARGLRPLTGYRLKITLADRARSIRRAHLDWVNIRPTYAHQIDDLNKVIAMSDPTNRFEDSVGHTLSGAAAGRAVVSGRTLDLTPAAGAPDPWQIAFVFSTQDLPSFSSAHLDQHYAYLWLRIDLTLDDGSTHHEEFPTNGLFLPDF